MRALKISNQNSLVTAEKSGHARIISGFLWVALFLFLGKVAGAAKEMAIAWRYGVNPVVDAYVFVFNLLAWPGGVFAAVCLSLLVPLCSRWRQNEEALAQFRRELTGLTCCIALGVCAVIGAILWGVLIRGWAVQTAEQQKLALSMLFPLLGVIFPGFLIALFSAWTLTQGKQRNTLLEAVPACAILGLVLLPGLPDSSPLVVGTVAGFLLQAVFLAYPLCRDGLLDGIRLSFTSPVWKDFSSNFGLLLAGQFALGTTSVLDLVVGARLGPGELAVFNYSNRILGLLFSLGGIAISRAVLPVFSSLQNNPREMQRLVVRWAWLVGVLGGGIALFLWGVAPWVVRLFFERGAFDAAATNAVINAFQYSLIQLPFYFIWTILVSQLSAQWRFKVLLMVFVANIPVKICALFVFVPLTGIGGIYFSSFVMYFFSIFFILGINFFSAKRSAL